MPPRAARQAHRVAARVGAQAAGVAVPSSSPFPKSPRSSSALKFRAQRGHSHEDHSLPTTEVGRISGPPSLSPHLFAPRAYTRWVLPQRCGWEVEECLSAPPRRTSKKPRKKLLKERPTTKGFGGGGVKKRKIAPTHRGESSHDSSICPAASPAKQGRGSGEEQTGGAYVHPSRPNRGPGDASPRGA